jgi:hypothetical protein
VSTSAGRAQQRAGMRAGRNQIDRQRRDAGLPSMNAARYQDTPVDEAGEELTAEAMEELAQRLEQVERQRQAEMQLRTARIAQLINSIPEGVRDTPEARLMVERVVSSWTVPVSPATMQQWAKDWGAFLATTPEGKAESAAKAGLFVPGVSDRPQGQRTYQLWHP